MEKTLILLLVVAILVAAYNYFRDKSDEDEADDGDAAPRSDMSNQQEHAITVSDQMEKRNTRDFFLDTLSKIGCQYEIDEDNDTIIFAYQGEYFQVYARDESPFVTLYDTHWAHIELCDIDEFARLQKAINQSNINNSVITVYTIDEAGGNVDVHCKSVVLFIPELPSIADYLRLELGEFFRVHNSISAEMEKLRKAEQADS